MNGRAPLALTLRLAGPAGSKGESVANGGVFQFEALPWLDLRKPGDRSGEVECVKASHSRRVFLCPEGAAFGSYLGEPSGRLAGRRIYVKRYLINKIRRRIGTLLSGPKAEREFRLGRRLLAAGLPVPEPLAFAYHAAPFPVSGSGALPPASYLASLEWPNQGSVKELLTRSPAESARLASDLAAFLARAHLAGFYHDDCAADHILAAPDEATDFGTKASASRFAFIDLDGARLFRGPLDWRRRSLNLFQILRSINFQALDAERREKFLEAYLASEGDPSRPSLAHLMERIDAIARRKIGRSVLKEKG